VEKEAEERVKKLNKPKKKEDELPDDVRKAKERLIEIRDKYLTLKWDVDKGQLNPGKKAYYDKLKVEFEELQKKIEGVEEELKE